MKSPILTLLIALSVSFATKAADLIVDITGTGGAYSTLTAALAAANEGDRLMIYPNVTPFTENITIDKGLSLLSATEGERWSMSGTITISSALGIDKEVNIVSMHSLTGSIAGSGNISGGLSQVRVLNCKIDSGNLTFNLNGFELTVSSDSLMNGYVQLRKGKVTGNYITTSAQNAGCVYTYSSTTQYDDPIYIVGNHLVGTSYSYFNQSPDVIQLASNASPFYVANNYIEMTTTYQEGIYISNTKTSGTLENSILNNTIHAPNTTNTWAIVCASFNSQVNVYNNLITGNQTYGIICTSANNLNFQASYNYVEAATTTIQGFLDDGTNVLNDPQTIDTATGELTAGSGIDGGNPDAAFTDLDLTTNDAGCFGGSFSMENFLASATGARTTFMLAPRRVLVGETIDIQGEGFDY